MVTDRWIDEFRADLVPAVQKLTQQLSGWEEDDPEEYPLNLIETMNSLVEYSRFLFRFNFLTHPDTLVKSEEFRAKLKYIVPILMDQLPNSPKGLHSLMKWLVRT